MKGYVRLIASEAVKSLTTLSADKCYEVEGFNDDNFTVKIRNDEANLKYYKLKYFYHCDNIGRPLHCSTPMA